MDITNKLITLNLNSNWQPIGFKTVKQAVIDMCGVDEKGHSTSLALDIEYNTDKDNNPILDEPLTMNPLPWEDWIKLTVRPWDFCISSINMTIRVPTVIISTNFSKMPFKHHKRNPSKTSIYLRDDGICQYSGKKIERKNASIDHIIPKSRGGQDTWTNLVLCSKEINIKKGNKLNKEVGLNLLREPRIPPSVPICALIKDVRHEDWKHFLIK